MSYDSHFKAIWDIFVLILAIYNSFIVPFEFAFISKHERAEENVLDIIIDVIFFVDLILSFFTSAITRQGIETFDSVKIRSLYISTLRFKTDLISVFGIRRLQKVHGVFTICALAKMFRVFRI